MNNIPEESSNEEDWDSLPFEEWKARIESLLAPLSPEHREEAKRRMYFEFIRRHAPIMMEPPKRDHPSKERFFSTNKIVRGDR